MQLEKLTELAAFLEKELKDELARQGHIATGALQDSIRVEVLEESGTVAIIGYGSNIAKYVDWGRRPGGKRVPVDALRRWVIVKGIAPEGKKATSIAWAIQYSIWKNGIPTDGDERKKMFITRTLTGNKDRIIAGVKDAGSFFVGVEIQNIVREIKEKINVS